METYRQRWAIELCFACMKTKGFDIESTHLRHDDRLEKMFAIVSVAAAAALAASKNDNKIQSGKRKNPTRKKTTATPPETDYPREVAEAALAHAIQNKVEAAYRRSDLFEKRRLLMEEWAAYCQKS